MTRNPLKMRRFVKRPGSRLRNLPERNSRYSRASRMPKQGTATNIHENSSLFPGRPASWSGQEPLYGFSNFAFWVHMVILDVQERCGPQFAAGKRYSLQGYRRKDNVSSEPGAHKRDPLPL